MAKKIIWSPRAKNDRWEILEYWHNRNRSKNYSRKLFRKFQEAVQQIASHPEIGKITEWLLHKIYQVSPLRGYIVWGYFSTKISPFQGSFYLQRRDIFVEIAIPPPPAPEELHLCNNHNT